MTTIVLDRIVSFAYRVMSFRDRWCRSERVAHSDCPGGTGSHVTEPEVMRLDELITLATDSTCIFNTRRTNGAELSRLI